jgi:hypothetical protein
MTHKYCLPHAECSYCYARLIELRRMENALETSWERGEDWTRFVFAIDYGF